MALSTDLEQQSILSLSLESDLLLQSRHLGSPEQYLSRTPIRSNSTLKLRSFQLNRVRKPRLRDREHTITTVTGTMNERKTVKRHAFPMMNTNLGLNHTLSEVMGNGGRKKEESALWGVKEPSALIKYLQTQKKRSLKVRGSEGLYTDFRSRSKLAKPRVLPPVLGLSYSRLLEHSETTVLESLYP